MLVEASKSLLHRSLPAILKHSIAKQSSAVVKSVPGLAWEARVASVAIPPNTNLTTLNNGARIASENWGGPLCAVGVYLDLGSRYERDHETGATHFLKNLFFEGTEKHKKTELSKQLTKVSAFSDAYITRENTAVYAVCLPKDVEKTVDLLCNMVLHPNFDKVNVVNARSNVLEHLLANEQKPREILDHYMHMIGYMHTPLENPVLGRYTNCETITADTIANFHKNNVKGPRIVLAAAGGVDHQLLVDAASKHLESVDNNYSDEVPDLTSCRYTGSYTYHREDTWPHCYTMLAIEAPGWDELDKMLVFKLATFIFGQWDRTHGLRGNSPFRLAQQVADDRYLQLYDTFYKPYYKTGLWGNYAVMDVEEANEFMSNLQWEWRYLSTLVNDADVEMGKNFMKQDLLQSMESSATVCDDLGKQILRYGRRHAIPDILHRIDQIDAAKIKEEFNQYMYDRDPVHVGFGKTGNLEFHHYWDVRYRMYWWLR